MTLLWIDSFDHYGTVLSNMTDGAWAEANGTISGTQARTGAKSYQIGGNTIGRRVFGGAKTTAGVGGAFYCDILPITNQTTDPIIFCDAGNVPQVTVTLDTTGVISVYRGGPGVNDRFTAKLGDSGSPVITAAAWNHIEAKVKISNSIGTVEVRVNGVTVINLSAQDTDSGSGEVSQVRFEVTGAGVAGFYVDDVYAWDTAGSLNNDFIGDRKVVTDFPDADTADVAWTRSTGSTNFGVIDENPPNGDTDYLTTVNTGDKAGVTFPDLPAEVTGIAAVVFVQKTKKTDAGIANTQLHLGSSGDTANGADRPMTTQYTLYHDVFETDPHTSAPFTRTAAQDASWTIERTA